MIGLILGLTGTVLAQDRGGDGGTACKDCEPEKPVIVKELDEYEKLLDGLWNDDKPGIVYQMAPGTMDIIGPGADGRLGKVGKVVTKKSNPDWPWGVVTEDWILYDPDVLLTSEIEADWCCVGSVESALTEYQAMPDA